MQYSITFGLVLALFMRASSCLDSNHDCNEVGLQNCVEAIKQSFSLCHDSDIDCQCAAFHDTACHNVCTMNEDFTFIKDFADQKCMSWAEEVAAAAVRFQGDTDYQHRDDEDAFTFPGLDLDIGFENLGLQVQDRNLPNSSLASKARDTSIGSLEEGETPGSSPSVESNVSEKEPLSLPRVPGNMNSKPPIALARNDEKDLSSKSTGVHPSVGHKMTGVTGVETGLSESVEANELNVQDSDLEANDAPDDDMINEVFGGVQDSDEQIDRPQNNSDMLGAQDDEESTFVDEETVPEFLDADISGERANAIPGSRFEDRVPRNKQRFKDPSRPQMPGNTLSPGSKSRTPRERSQGHGQNTMKKDYRRQTASRRPSRAPLVRTPVDEDYRQSPSHSVEYELPKQKDERMRPAVPVGRRQAQGFENRYRNRVGADDGPYAPRQRIRDRRRPVHRPIVHSSPHRNYYEDEEGKFEPPVYDLEDFEDEREETPYHFDNRKKLDEDEGSADEEDEEEEEEEEDDDDIKKRIEKLEGLSEYLIHDPDDSESDGEANDDSDSNDESGLSLMQRLKAKIGLDAINLIHTPDGAPSSDESLPPTVDVITSQSTTESSDQPNPQDELVPPMAEEFHDSSLSAQHMVGSMPLNPPTVNIDSDIPSGETPKNSTNTEEEKRPAESSSPDDQSHKESGTSGSETSDEDELAGLSPEERRNKMVERQKLREIKESLREQRKNKEYGSLAQPMKNSKQSPAQSAFESQSGSLNVSNSAAKLYQRLMLTTLGPLGLVLLFVQAPSFVWAVFSIGVAFVTVDHFTVQ